MDLLSQFKNYLFSQKDLPAKVTVKNYLSDVNHFIRWYEFQFKKNFDPKTITRQTIEQYKKDSLRLDNRDSGLETEAGNSNLDIHSSNIESQGLTSNFQRLSSRSLERHLSSLRKFFNFLKLEGLVSLDPFHQPSASNHQPADPYKITDFKNFLYVYNASHLTIKNYLIDLRQFIAWAEEVLATDEAFDLKDKNILGRIDSNFLEEYKTRLINEGNFSPATVNRKLSSLRKYLSWAELEGLITNNLDSGTQNLDLNRNASKNVRLELQQFSNKATEQFPKSGESFTVNPKSYSRLAPIRLFQKLSEIGIFAFDQFLTIPFAKGFDKISYLTWLAKGKPVFTKARKSKLSQIPTAIGTTSIFQLLNPAYGFKRQASRIKNIPKEFYAPLDISTKYFPWYKKTWFMLRYKRPKWYKTYHSYPIAHYFNFAILIIFMAVIGFGFYQSFFQKPATGQPALAAFPNAPIRILSFQGRLTDNQDNPISTPSALRFAIYNAQAPATGSALLWQEVDPVSPDQDGIFSVLLGNAGDCPVGQTNPTGPCGIPQWLFASNSALFLGVSVNTTPEMTPRQQLATVAYAANSETLQGLPPITQTNAGQTNVVLALDSSGNLTIGGSANPTFQASGGQFTISGQPLLLTTNAGSNSNITLTPDGAGKIALDKPLVNTSNSNNIATAVGSVEVDSLFSVLATSSGQSAVTINQTGGGPLISASQSGTAKFTVDGSGNTTIASGGIYSVGTSPGLSLTNACVNTTGGIVTGTGTCPGGGTDLYWTQLNGNGVANGGILFPNNSTVDFLIGGQSTAAAKFSITGMSNLSNQVNASLSGQLIVMANKGWGGNATISGALTLGAFSNPVIQTTNNQLLTIGGATTGDIVLAPANNVSGSNVVPGADNVTDLGLSGTRWKSVNATVYNSGANLGQTLTNACVNTTGGIVTGTGTCPTQTGTNWWNQLAGALSPVNTTNDFLLGSTATSSALFSFTGVKTGQTIASVSGQLIVMPNNGYGGNATISGALTLGAFSNPVIQTTNNQLLTIGGNTTGNITLTPNNGTAGLVSISGSSAFTTGTGLTTLGGNLTVSGTTITLASGTTIDGSGTISIGTTNATTLTLGRSTQGITLPAWATNNNSVLVTGVSGAVSAITTTTAGQCFLSQASGNVPQWTACPSAIPSLDLYWNQLNGNGVSNGGIIFTNNSTVDFLVGGQSTASADFAITGLSNLSNQVNATLSGQLIVMPNKGWGGNATISGALTLGAFSNPVIQTTNNQLLTIGGNTTGNITLTPNNGTAGILNLNAPTLNTNAATLGLFNTTATTINFAQGTSTALNIGPSGGTMTLGNGGAYTLTTGTNQNLSVNPNGSGGLSLNTAGTGTVGIGNATGAITLNGNTSVAAGKTLTLSAMTAGNNQILFAANTTGIVTSVGTTTTSGLCLMSAASIPAWGTCPTGTNWWNQLAGALSPINTTNDLLLGSTATSSAVFSFTGLQLSTHQTQASFSGQFVLMPNNGYGGSATIAGQLTLGALGNPGAIIQSVKNQLLTIGGNTTGDIQFTPGNSSTSLYLASTGNVGIGTNSPAQKLEIDNSGHASIRVADTTNSQAIALGSTKSGNAGPYLEYSGDLIFASRQYAFVGSGGSGLEEMRLTSVGNLGIGTTPVAPLHINGAYGSNAALIVNQLNSGDIFTASASGATKFTVTNTGGLALGVATNVGTNAQCITGGATAAWGACGGANWWNELAGALSPVNINDDFLVGGTATSTAEFSFTGVKTGQTIASISGQLVVMPNNGYGGSVGVNTTNPISQLQVNANTLYSNSEASRHGFMITSGDVLASNTELYMGADDSNSLSYIQSVGHSGFRKLILQGRGGNVSIGTITNSNKLDVSGGASFGTYAGTVAPANGVIISGNVGIGTNAPVAPLHIAGAYGANAALVVDQLYSGDIIAASASGNLQFKVANNGSVYGRAFYDLDNTNYYLDPAATGTSLVTVGAVGLGTTSPLAMLDVRGNSGTTPVASFSGQTSFAALVVDNKGVGDLITASGSGQTRFIVKNNGDVVVGPSGNGKLTALTLDPLYTIDGTKYSTYGLSMVGVKEEVTGRATLTYNLYKQAYSYEIDLNNQPTGSDLWLFASVTDRDINLTSILLTPDSSSNVWYEKGSTGRTITLYSDSPTSVSYRLTAPRFDHEKWANLSDETDPNITGLIVPPSNSSTDSAQTSTQSAQTSLAFDIQPVLDTFGNTIYQLIDSFGNSIVKLGRYSELLAANVKAGFIDVQRISADSITALASSFQSLTSNQIISPIASIDEIHTNLISPLGQGKDLVIKLASSSATDNSELIIQNASGSTVASIDNSGNATFSGQLSATSGQFGDATISGTLHAGKILASDIVGLQPSSSSATYVTNITNVYSTSTPSASSDPFPTLTATANQQSATGSGTIASSYIDLASYSAMLANIPNLNVQTATFTQGLMSFGPTSLSDTSVVGQLSINGNLILADSSINVLGTDLQLQPLKQGGLSVMAGLFYIDTNGNVKVGGNAEFAKDVTVGGKLSANVISPIPGNDLAVGLPDKSNLMINNSSNSAILAINQSGDLTASGSGTFGKLNLSLVQPAFALSNTEVVATGSAGTASIRAYQNQITIDNPLVTEKSLIYVTPKSNQQVYLMRQVPGVSFTVGVQNPSLTDIPFNWIIVN